MRRRRVSDMSLITISITAVLSLGAAACGGSSADTGASPDDSASAVTADSESADTAPATDEPAATTPQSTTPPSTESPAPPPPPTEMRLGVTGPEEIVFDWSNDRCEDMSIPDTATRIVRDSKDQLSLYIGNETTYRMTGPDLDTLSMDCANPVMSSAYNSDPSMFTDAEWISSTFTEDGETVYAIIHNEYLGLNHRDAYPGQCPSGDNFNCIDVTLTLGVSTDGGATFQHARPAPDHMIATMPYVYDDEGVASGFWHPSNLVDEGDGYRYMLMDIATTPADGGDIGDGWICALRTDDVSDPDSWRFWNGEDFAGVIVDPYRDDITDAEICTAIDFPALSAELTGSIVWVDSLDTFVTVGGSYEPGTDQQNWGIYYSTSDDLIDWSPRRLLFATPQPETQAAQADLTFLAYPTIIDPDSESRNFDTTDGSADLYATRFNEGGNSLDRDLLRIPIAFEEYTFEPAVWNFDAADSDPGEWQPTGDLSELTVVDGTLAMTSIGADPQMTATGLRIASEFDQLTITMTADAGGPSVGQVFFLTEDDTIYDDTKFAWFEVVGDGSTETIEIDMSEVPEWDGVITALRIDPVEGTPVDATVAIDSITITD